MPIRWLTIFLDTTRELTDTSVGFWADVTGTTVSPWRGDFGEFATLVPADGDAYLRVQQVHDGPGGSHLDVHVDRNSESIDGASARAEAVGARLINRVGDVILFESPGGFPFCLVPWDGESSSPSPADVGDAGACQADQLCLDVPPDLFDAECDFWSALTGWNLRSAARQEFRGIVRPDGIPVRLLFQRLDQAPSGGRVSGHVDFACSDYISLADRHVAAGARVVARFPFWIVMADPAGRTYCLTARDPVTGRLTTSS